MSIPRYVAAYLAAGVLLFGLDFIWLRFAGPALFQPEVGEMLSAKPHLAPAVLFYLLYPLGVVVLAILPGLRQGAFSTALLNGAVLGFIAYMTFDLSNLAILRLWSVKIAVIDIGWGTFLTALSAFAGYAAATAMRA
jgi:uncharacterized membrane protein